MSPPSAGRSAFGIDVMKLVGGTTFAQLLGILLAPVFARLFAPEAFGVAALFASILSTLQVIVCLRYELTIMLPKEENEAANLSVVSIIAALLISLLTVPLVLVGGKAISERLQSPSLEPYLWLLPISLFVSGLYATLSAWTSRKQQFGRLSVSQVTNTMIALLGRLGIGLAGFVGGGTIISTTIFGSVFSTGILTYQVWRDEDKKPWADFRWRTLLNAAKRYYKFPLYNAGASFLNILSWQLPVFFLAFFFSPAIVGYYSLGNRLIRMPMRLIGNSVSQVFYQRASSAKEGEDLSALVETILSSLIGLTLFPLLILTLIGDDLFRVFLGEQWVEAGVYSQILAMWMFFWFISSPLSSLYNVHEKQESLLGLQFGIFLSRLISLTIGGLLGDARLCLVLFGVSGVITYAYLCLNILTSSGVPLRRVVTIFFYYLRLFIPAGLILLLMKAIGTRPLLNVVAAILLFIIYFVYLFYTDKKINQLIGNLFLRFTASKTNS